MNIPYADFKPLENELRPSINEAIQSVLQRSWYINGPEGHRFEEKFAQYCAAKYCIGCGSGLDALMIALKAIGIGPGDEVIVPANTFIASALAVSYAGATPILVEPLLETYNLDPAKLKGAITPKTKAIMVVHLYGQPAEMKDITSIAQHYGIAIIEDCAQAHGAIYQGKRVGSFGDVAGFSFYPGKNLGAFGDAGALVTSNESFARSARILHNYGAQVKYHHDMQGYNSRLDEIQASVLSCKLASLDNVNEKRRLIADRMLNEINNPLITLPTVIESATPVWHIFAVRCDYREQLKEYLSNKGIETNMHYPVPIHLQKAYRSLGYKRGDFPIAEKISATELSLPMYYGMTDEQISFLIQAINDFEV